MLSPKELEICKQVTIEACGIWMIFGVISKVDAYEPMAMYEAVVRHMLDNPIFSNREEICQVIRSLVQKKILDDKEGDVNGTELKYLLQFGDIKTKDKRVLTFHNKEAKSKSGECTREIIHRNIPSTVIFILVNILFPYSYPIHLQL